ncbi:hypothetical protein V8F20_000192 [Naviculisporaceae sp. PSN 640]
MFESWYSSRVEDEEPTKFWLEFQVISDGFEEESAAGIDTPKFHLFPQLPAELRLKIWHCLIRPRIVLAACLSSRPSTHKPLYRKISQRPKRRYFPILLHICSESRAYALEHYELTFPWKTPHRLRASSPSYSYSYSAASSRQSPTKSAQNEKENFTENGYNPAKVYFNYELDTLFLLGELEPSDGHGFNAPMVYFLRREDTSRVRHVACAFEELHLGVYDTDLIFGSLFHIVDRFPSARGKNTAKPTHQYLIITTTPSDASIFPQSRHNQQQNSSLGFPTTNNVIQKLWRAWAMGSGYWPGSGASTAPLNSLVNTQMVMVREEELAAFVAQIE